MNITVIGTGFVGVVTSAVLAKFGNTVIGLDVDATKIDKLNQGQVPFYEPQLEDLLKEGLAKKTLSFTTEYAQAIPNADVIFIAVGTPSAPDGTADLKYVKAAAESLAPHLKPKAIVGLKSTVPPGTCDLVRDIIAKHQTQPFHVVSVPEFLKEGSAVHDTLHPDRVVIGATDPKVIKTLLALHEPLGGQRIVISPESAQMAKYSANAYLAQRITFINQIADLCEQNGANIQEVIQAIGADARIGNHYWYPGLGYGGSCFPKDVKELAAYARSVGEADSILVKIDALNEARIIRKLEQFEKEVGGWSGKTVAVLGLSFKPHTNDMREAPSLKVIPALQQAGAAVKAYDPQALKEAKPFFPEAELVDDPYQAVEAVEVIILLTEWPQVTSLDLERIATLAKPKAVFIDTRNQYKSDEMVQAGLRYIGIGM